MSKVGQQIIAAMEELLADMESGKPIRVTQVRRVETPDGPMHELVETTLQEHLKGTSHERTDQTEG